MQVLPLANPLRVAEEAAIVDQISEGRLIFGVGRSSFLESYQGYNVDYEESRALFFESLEVIQRAWRDAPFSYEGHYYQFHEVDLVPKPYQQPHPPIRVAVESRDTFPLIGKLGFPIFIRYQMDTPELQELLKQYQEERHAAGFSGPNDVILQIAAYVAETAEKAYTEPEASTMQQRRLVREALGRAGDQEAFERLRRLSEVNYDEVLQRVAYGTPEAVVERLQEYKEALGITGVALDMNPGGQIPMNPQQAMDAPRCASFSFPRSSDPHPYRPGLCRLEARLDSAISEALLRMGHKLCIWPAWTKAAGSLGAIQVDHERGVLHGAADPRRMAYAIGRRCD